MFYIVTLIAVGLLLLFLEIILMPGFAITGILGLAALAGSWFYALKVFGDPVATVVLVVDIVLVTAVVVYVLRAKTWKRFQLKTNIDSKASGIAEGEVEVGDRGRTVSRLAPAGSARFGTRTYEVKSLEGYIEEGEDVEIVLIEDNRILVRLAD